MRKLLILIGMLLLPVSIMASSIKIGTVDIQKISPVMRSLFANQDNSKLSAVQSEMNKLQTSLAELQNKLKDKNQMSKDKGKALQTSITNLQNKLRSKRTEMMEKMRSIREEQQKTFREKWDILIAQVAKQKDIDVIVPNNVILFANDKVDVTDEVIKKLKENMKIANNKKL